MTAHRSPPARSSKSAHAQTPRINANTRTNVLATPAPLIGLNLFRALAILLMIVAHSARLQTNLPAISHQPSLAGLADRCILFVLHIEPIISAMFLFIAGFSLVLSHAQRVATEAQWLRRQAGRALQLYGIAIVFQLADAGPQWPDTLVSPGILSVIAVAVVAGAVCLTLPWQWQALAVLTLTGGVLTAILEQTRVAIPGINAGAGGMFPLVTLAWLGALTGLARARWPQYGLQIVLGISLLPGMLALGSDYPWTVLLPTTLRLYPGDHVGSLLASLQDMVGLYNGAVQVRTTQFWNHSSIFALRALPLLVLMLIVLLSVFRSAQQAVVAFCHRMGSQALNLYVLHLVLLAPLELSGIKPTTGWQTLLVVVAIVAVSPCILRHVSLVPWRIGRERPADAKTNP
jgi:hypothetical protein